MEKYMNIKDNGLFNEYLDFLVERQKVFIKKRNGDEYPWSSDHVLNRAKINNIFRQQDKFTCFELKEIEDQSFEEQLYRILILRHSISINIYNLFKDKKDISLSQIYELRDKIGSGNDFISQAVIFPIVKGHTREQLLLFHYDKVRTHYCQSADYILKCSTGEEVVEHLCSQYPFLGPFRAYEVFTSLTYCKGFQFNSNDFLHIGPGSMKTFSKLIGHKVSLNDCLILSRYVKEKLVELGFDFNGFDFTVRTLEDSFCEFRKYNDVKKGIKKTTYKIYCPSFFDKTSLYAKKGVKTKSKYWMLVDFNSTPTTKAAYILLSKHSLAILNSCKDSIGLKKEKNFFSECFEKSTDQANSKKARTVFNSYFPILVANGFFIPCD